VCVCVFMPLYLLMSVFIFAVDTNLDHYTFSGHLLFVSAVFGHHQVHFTKTCMENNTETEISPSKLIH